MQSRAKAAAAAASSSSRRAASGLANTPVPLGASRRFEALDARVLVEERALRAQALRSERDALRAQSGLLERAKLALRREPPHEDPWKMLQQGASVDELLAHGYTFFELAARGVTLYQMLEHATARDLGRLGATYETLLRAGVAEALEKGSITLKQCLEICGTRASLAVLLRDRVIASASALASLRPSAKRLARQEVDVELLLRYNLDLDAMLEFNFTFDEWTQRLGLKKSHLAKLGFRLDEDSPKFGWDASRLRDFLR